MLFTKYLDKETSYAPIQVALSQLHYLQHVVQDSTLKKCVKVPILLHVFPGENLTYNVGPWSNVGLEFRGRDSISSVFQITDADLGQVGQINHSLNGGLLLDYQCAWVGLHLVYDTIIVHN